jgi:hypothetical protein
MITELTYNSFTIEVIWEHPGPTKFLIFPTIHTDKYTFYLNFDKPIDKTMAWAQFVNDARKCGYYQYGNERIPFHKVDSRNNVKIVHCS